MNTTIWVIQGLLSIIFLLVGLVKISQPKEKLKEKVGNWVDDFSANQIRTIGTLEVLASIVLIFPMILNIFPILTPLAAIGLVLDMTVAAMTHLKRKEKKLVGVNIALLFLALFVVYGRFVLVPVT